MESLSILLYVLGSILLVILIILGIKLIKTVDKVNLLMDDVQGKVKSLDGLFSVIDYATDKISLLGDKISDGITAIVKKLFVRKKKESEETDE